MKPHIITIIPEPPETILGGTETNATKANCVAVKLFETIVPE